MSSARAALRSLLAGGGGVPCAATHWRDRLGAGDNADAALHAAADELARRAPSPPPAGRRGGREVETSPVAHEAPPSPEAALADVALAALIGTLELLVTARQPALAQQALRQLQDAAAARHHVETTPAALSAASSAALLRCSRALAALVGDDDADVAAAAILALNALCRVLPSPTPRALLGAALVKLPPQRQTQLCETCLPATAEYHAAVEAVLQTMEFGDGIGGEASAANGPSALTRAGVCAHGALCEVHTSLAVEPRHA